ncbi:uncharacterized protein LOC118433479 [Folsomia candida]|uniref:uncharacterized protein LOC118433479 n=1 Tax=Folsomia candida TaxID=158441 RepID=UPI00160555B3|nr:uncharacterized protein LOC118433479 [Folsomia candida]
MVSASWGAVIGKGQIWRLLIAHFFNFQKVPLWVNCFALITIGRYLERKVQKGALLVIIQTVGVLSNLLYVLLNSFFCSSVQGNEQTYGFNSINYALRFWLVYIQEPRNFEAGQLFGFWNNLPIVWQPWPIILDILLLKFLEMENPGFCVASSVVGIMVGVVLTWLVWRFPPELWQNLGGDEDEVGPDDDADDAPQPMAVTRHSSTTTSVSRTTLRSPPPPPPFTPSASPRIQPEMETVSSFQTLNDVMQNIHDLASDSYHIFTRRRIPPPRVD